MSDDDHNSPDGFDPVLPESLLPYEGWIEEAHRDIMLKAIEYVAAEGLPGGHHFYLTFRTDYPGVQIPSHLRARYPEEMTIVLQHQFWDLTLDRQKNTIAVSLSFSGTANTLIIPADAVTAFADPHVHMALRFSTPETEDEPSGDRLTPQNVTALEGNPPSSADETEDDDALDDHKGAEVVNLASFRKQPQKD